MFVEVVDGVGAVREAENLKALSLRGSAADAARDGALVPAVADDGSHVWLAVAELKSRAAATVADPAGWGEGFDGMIAYAGSKGWLNEAGDAVRAHVEPPTSA
ncbi:MAG: hypothetical protein RL238_1020 [Actinomycetota bacterium]|jgi:hypothetical protein